MTCQPSSQSGHLPYKHMISNTGLHHFLQVNIWFQNCCLYIDSIIFNILFLAIRGSIHTAFSPEAITQLVDPKVRKSSGCNTFWDSDECEWYASPGHIALSWSLCSEPLAKFQKQYPKPKFWISEIFMQPVFYYLAFCIANPFILPKSTRKQVNDPNWKKNFNNLWISQYFKIG